MNVKTDILNGVGSIAIRSYEKNEMKVNGQMVHRKLEENQKKVLEERDLQKRRRQEERFSSKMTKTSAKYLRRVQQVMG